MIGFGEVRGICGGEGLTMLVGLGKERGIHGGDWASEKNQ